MKKAINWRFLCVGTVIIVIVFSVISSINGKLLESIQNYDLRLDGGVAYVVSSEIVPQDQELVLSAVQLELLQRILKNSIDGEGRKTGLYDELYVLEITTDNGDRFEIEVLKQNTDSKVILILTNIAFPQIMLDSRDLEAFAQFQDEFLEN